MEGPSHLNGGAQKSLPTSIEKKSDTDSDVEIRNSLDIDLSEAQRFQNTHDYQAALAIYLRWFNGTDTKAYYHCREMLVNLFESQTSDTEIEKIIDFCEEKSESCPAALIVIGLINEDYYDDKENALIYYKRAVESNLAIAGLVIWHAYENNQFGDRSEAIHALKMAVNAGVNDAQLCIANVYRLGKHVVQNYPKALRYYVTINSDSFETLSKDPWLLSVFASMPAQHFSFLDADLLELGLTCLEEDKQYKKLGELYKLGLGVERDPLTAFEYYKLHNEDEDQFIYPEDDYGNEEHSKCDDGQDHLLTFLISYNEGKLDAEFCNSYLLIACLADDLCEFRLADQIRKSLELKKNDLNYTSVLDHFKKSNAVENFRGSFYLAVMYEHGLGVEPSMTEAFKYYKQAYRQKDQYLKSPNYQEPGYIREKIHALCLNGVAGNIDREFTREYFLRYLGAPLTNTQNSSTNEAEIPIKYFWKSDD